MPRNYRTRIIAILIISCSLGLSFIARDPHTKTLYLPTRSASSPLTPENTIIAFDIHSVLVKKNRSGMIWQAIKNIGAINHLRKKEIRDHLNSIEKSSASPEDFFFSLIEKFPEIEPYIPGLLNLVNSQDPMPGMKELLKKLHEKGFKLYVLSNIGHAAFYGWQSKKTPGLSTKGLKDMYPEIFSYFSGEQVASRKPHAQAYTGFKAKFAQTNGQTPKRVIFIDDRWDFIEGATAQGLIGIWFKNTQQVETDFMRLGIL